MKIYKKKCKSIIFYMSIEEQKREKEKECEMELWEKKLEEREKILKNREKIVEKKEEILSNIWSDIQNIRESIHKSLGIFDNSVSDDPLEMKGLLSQFKGYNFKTY